MSDIRVEFQHYDQFAERLRQAPEIVREEMGRGVERAAQAGEGQAKRLAPVKTGNLRRSITHTKASFAGGSVSASYGTNVPYARWVEEGRGPVVARNARVLRFTIGGKVFFRKRVGPARGKRFMKGSRDWLEPQLHAEFRAVVQRIINRIGG